MNVNSDIYRGVERKKIINIFGFFFNCFMIVCLLFVYVYVNELFYVFLFWFILLNIGNLLYFEGYNFLVIILI